MPPPESSYRSQRFITTDSAIQGAADAISADVRMQTRNRRLGNTAFDDVLVGRLEDGEYADNLDWNQIEWTIEGRRVQVRLNGQKILHCITSSTRQLRSPDGYAGACDQIMRSVCVNGILREHIPFVEHALRSALAAHAERHGERKERPMMNIEWMAAGDHLQAMIDGEPLFTDNALLRCVRDTTRQQRTLSGYSSAFRRIMENLRAHGASASALSSIEGVLVPALAQHEVHNRGDRSESMVRFEWIMAGGTLQVTIDGEPLFAHNAPCFIADETEAEA